METSKNGRGEIINIGIMVDIGCEVVGDALSLKIE
jgi:hypothetical protein